MCNRWRVPLGHNPRGGGASMKMHINDLLASYLQVLPTRSRQVESTHKCRRVDHFPREKEYIQGIKFLFQKGKLIYFQKNDKKESLNSTCVEFRTHNPRHSTFGQSCGAQLLVRKRCAFCMLFTFLYVSSGIEKGGGAAANGYLEL